MRHGRYQIKVVRGSGGSTRFAVIDTRLERVAGRFALLGSAVAEVGRLVAQERVA